MLLGLSASFLLLALGLAPASSKNLRANQGCQVGGQSFGGLAHYLVGERRAPGSIYADCVNGEATCFEDDGISDTIDRQVDCDSLDLSARKRQLGVFIQSDRAWPERVVCIRWDEQFSDKGKEFFEKAFTEYAEKTDIVFTDINHCKSTYGDNTDVCSNCKTAVSLKKSKPGCFASVGFIKGDYQPELNVGEGCEWYNTYVHELGHVVGLFHEHAHPQRQVVMLRDKLRVSSSNYVKDTNSQTLQYDLMSIMHYDGEDMCLPKDGSIKFCDVSQSEADGCVVPTEEHCDRGRQQEFGKGQQLSEHDVSAIRKLYEKAPRNPKSPGGSKESPAPVPAATTTRPEERREDREEKINVDEIEGVLKRLDGLLSQ